MIEDHSTNIVLEELRRGRRGVLQVRVQSAPLSLALQECLARPHAGLPPASDIVTAEVRTLCLHHQVVPQHRRPAHRRRLVGRLADRVSFRETIDTAQVEGQPVDHVRRRRRRPVPAADHYHRADQARLFSAEEARRAAAHEATHLDESKHVRQRKHRNLKHSTNCSIY